MTNLARLIGNTDGFLNKVFHTLEQDGVNVSGLELDHLCYRVETPEQYNQLRTELLKLGKIISEIEINGRPIATFKLKTPILYQERNIFILELPFPKTNRPYPKGLEHVEFVINKEFDEFMKQYPHIKFDTSDTQKQLNSDIKIQYSGFSVKFHHMSLEQVIKHEKEENN